MMHILLVEDHADSAAAFTRLLVSMGHEVVCATTLAEARLACARQRFDLLLCDLMLPDGDGCELMRELRERCGTRGIAVTARAFAHDHRRSDAAGFSAHLCKPFPFNVLLEAVEEVGYAPEHPQPPAAPLASA